MYQIACKFLFRRSIRILLNATVKLTQHWDHIQPKFWWIRQDDERQGWSCHESNNQSYPWWLPRTSWAWGSCRGRQKWRRKSRWCCCHRSFQAPEVRLFQIWEKIFLLTPISDWGYDFRINSYQLSGIPTKIQKLPVNWDVVHPPLELIIKKP